MTSANGGTYTRQYPCNGWVDDHVPAARVKCSPHLLSFSFFLFIKNWKTSAVSTIDWMVETQLCELRSTSDTFVGRAYSILRSISFTIYTTNRTTDLQNINTAVDDNSTTICVFLSWRRCPQAFQESVGLYSDAARTACAVGTTSIWFSSFWNNNEADQQTFHWHFIALRAAHLSTDKVATSENERKQDETKASCGSTIAVSLLKAAFFLLCYSYYGKLATGGSKGRSYRATFFPKFPLFFSKNRKSRKNRKHFQSLKI